MTTFPQYRKLEGFLRFYEIIDDRTFVEAVVLNGKISHNRVEAQQYPEILRIQDMLNREWNYRDMEQEEITQYFSGK
jgi:hypothetical protein